MWVHACWLRTWWLRMWWTESGCFALLCCMCCVGHSHWWQSVLLGLWSCVQQTRRAASAFTWTHVRVETGECIGCVVPLRTVHHLSCGALADVHLGEWDVPTKGGEHSLGNSLPGHLQQLSCCFVCREEKAPNTSNVHVSPAVSSKPTLILHDLSVP